GRSAEVHSQMPRWAGEHGTGTPRTRSEVMRGKWARTHGSHGPASSIAGGAATGAERAERARDGVSAAIARQASVLRRDERVAQAYGLVAEDAVEDAERLELLRALCVEPVGILETSSESNLGTQVLRERVLKQRLEVVVFSVPGIAQELTLQPRPGLLNPAVGGAQRHAVGLGRELDGGAGRPHAHHRRHPRRVRLVTRHHRLRPAPRAGPGPGATDTAPYRVPAPGRGHGAAQGWTGPDGCTTRRRPPVPRCGPASARSRWQARAASAAAPGRPPPPS